MRKFVLDQRLAAAASLVRLGAIVADIGCDHGMLAAHLVMEGKAKHVYASDVNEKPLSQAKALIQRYGLEQSVTTVLSDGLEQIPQTVDTIIMCGMGGELIADLIQPAKWVFQPGKRLVLQPMTFVDKLRKWLAYNGFTIQKEIPVLEPTHTYCVMAVEYTGQTLELSDFQAVAGKIPPSTKEGQEYLQRQLKKYTRMLHGLEHAKQKNEKQEQIQQLVEALQEYLNHPVTE